MPRGEGTPAAVMPRSALPVRAEAVTSATETLVHQITIRRALPYAKCFRWALRWIFIWPVAGDEHHQVCASALLRSLKEPHTADPEPPHVHAI
jgi:hypothetical protein